MTDIIYLERPVSTPSSTRCIRKNIINWKKLEDGKYYFPPQAGVKRREEEDVQRKRKENVEKGTQKNAPDVDVGREEDEYILFNI